MFPFMKGCADSILDLLRHSMMRKFYFANIFIAEYNFITPVGIHFVNFVLFDTGFEKNEAAFRAKAKHGLTLCYSAEARRMKRLKNFTPSSITDIGMRSFVPCVVRSREVLTRNGEYL